MSRLRRTRAHRAATAALAVSLAWSAPLAAQDDGAEDARPDLALMGTIPLYWGEVASLADMIDSASHAHWARPVIERDYTLVPLDFLTSEVLEKHDVLLMAQPRALAATENVTLDAWVRAGGRLLLFADPMMTGESRFPLGDRRRPQDVSLLSPILAHWGLDLQFDAEQSEGVRQAQVGGHALPVNMAGRLVAREGSACRVSDQGLLAHCPLEEGHATIVADAALLDVAGPHPGAEAALEALLDNGFGPIGDNAGNAGSSTAIEHGNGEIAPHSGDEHRAETPGRGG